MIFKKLNFRNLYFKNMKMNNMHVLIDSNCNHTNSAELCVSVEHVGTNYMTFYPDVHDPQRMNPTWLSFSPNFSSSVKHLAQTTVVLKSHSFT